MAGIFKAYDIRGIYGKDLDDDTMFRIGRAFATFTSCRSVVVGRDMRPHSQPLFKALARGLTMQGADVVDIGLCSTPMSYFANATLKTDAGIMITASHNPGEWNGAKLSRAGAVPISGQTGIADIERIVKSGAFAAPAQKPGKITTHDIARAYGEHVRKTARLTRRPRVKMDMANAMGVVEAAALKDIFEITPLFDELDGTFPNHEANPLHHETLRPIRDLMGKGNFDFGVAFDGDADRAGFLDEKGGIIPMDMITALVAKDILSREKGVILYDLRSSWAVREIIEENGGTPMMCRVGHAFIKKQMRDNNAIFAGELSGHYYFRANGFTESTCMAAISVANIVSASSVPLSELVRPLRRYFTSGEINSEVRDTASVLKTLKSRYSDGRLLELDGVTVEYDDWWFNVRASNTEPLIRLNLEAKREDLMKTRQDELLGIIRA